MNMVHDFQRKQTNHVAIAYNIHFHHLKDQGIIKGGLNGINHEMDPTYAAKMVREKKKCDIIKGNENR